MCAAAAGVADWASGSLDELLIPGAAAAHLLLMLMLPLPPHNLVLLLRSGASAPHGPCCRSSETDTSLAGITAGWQEGSHHKSAIESENQH